MVEVSAGAKEDLGQFDKEVRAEILDMIEEKLGNNRDRSSISYVHKPDFGIEF